MTDLRRLSHLGLFAALVLAAALGGTVTADVAAPSLQVFDRGTLHVTRLDNGLRVVVKEDHSAPLVAVNIVIRAGTRCETPRNNGISHFLEHMIFRAARAGGEDTLSGPIEAVGGMINGGALRDFTSFRAVIASPHLGLALETLARALTHSAFDSKDVFSERLVLMRELQEVADRPEVAAWDLAFALAYGDHPYALPIGGTEASLVRINADDLAAYHRRWYTPGNASVIIVGDVEPARARQAAARAFSGWKGASTAPPVPPAPSLDRPRECTETREVAQATVLIGFLVPGISDPRGVCAADLLLTIVSEGYTARLRRALVDSKLADELSANFLTQALPGLFGIRVTCAPERVPEVRRAIETELARLAQEPLTDADLSRAQRVLTHGYVFANETAEDQAETLGFCEAIATYEFAAGYLDDVRALTAADVHAAARNYLNPSRSAWVAIMPKGPGNERREVVRAAAPSGAGGLGRRPQEDAR